jgi:hypothetical protein
MRRSGVLTRIGAITAAGALAAGFLLAAAGPATAQPAVLYAAVTATGAGDCSTVADACTLSTALGQVDPGGTVDLVTPGSTARYVGNWTFSTSGTSAGQPVTVEPLPGLSSQPILDGDGVDAPGGETCSTAACNGAVLTVPGGDYVALNGIAVDDAGNTSNGLGGGMSVSGTVTITGSTFNADTSIGGNGIGGAIDSGDGYAAGTGSVTAIDDTFSNDSSGYGGAIASGIGASSFGGGPGGGSVTVIGSTFFGDGSGAGGAIDSGDYGGGGGTVNVTGSTFYQDGAGSNGGAIASGLDAGGGTVNVTTSTFVNSGFGGYAIDSGDYDGGGTMSVTASTFANNEGRSGGAISTGRNGGGGTMSVAGDVFGTSCDQEGGTWNDGGYNAGGDASCFATTPATGDLNAGSTGALGLGEAFLADNGGPTQTVMPQTGSPVIGLIPDSTSVNVDGSPVTLCPATDQRGYASAPGACDAGAVQTTGAAGLTLADSSPTPGYRQVGDVISYNYAVTNTGTTTLNGLAIADPAVPGASCPDSALAPGTAETCTGSYTVTSADVTAGKVTDTATASGTTTVGGTVTSNASTTLVRVVWPASVTGTFRPPPRTTEGYYLGVTGNRWTLLITQPGPGKITFTGTVTTRTGKFTNLDPIGLKTSGTVSASANAKTLTFTIPDTGTVKGFKFTAPQPVTSITFTLQVNGQPAAATQIYLGSPPAQSASASPLVFTR